MYAVKNAPAYRMSCPESLHEVGFAVALTHDVDRVHKSFQSITHLIRHLRRGNLRHALYQVQSMTRRDRYWCFDKIRQIEMSRGLRSAFYFLNESYPFNLFKAKSWRLATGYYDIFQPEIWGIIKQLDAEGFEIGLHGSYRSYNDRSLMAKEKDDLESILGRPVAGIRQHYLNLSSETWEIQRSLGFLYDTSFGYRDRVGFKDRILRPFALDGRNDFYIIPQTVMDCCLMRLQDPWRQALGIVDQAESERAILVLNWHQQIFDEREFPGYCSTYERIVDECIRRRAEFILPGQLMRSHRASSAPKESNPA